MKDIELLPCPFCGAACHFEKDEGAWEWVECESCGMQGNRSASLMDDCKPILAAAWNRRAAIEADRAQRVPDGVVDSELVAHIRKHIDTYADKHPALLVRQLAGVLRTMLASTPAPAQQETSEGCDPHWSYYFRVTECKAKTSRDGDCICWHTEGTGPFDMVRHDDADQFLEWRESPSSAPAPAQQEPRIPAEFDVRSILLSISPWEDGMGYEVYAASVADVEGLLTSMGQELEEWQLGIRRLPTAAHQEPPQPVERKPMTDEQVYAMCDRLGLAQLSPLDLVAEVERHHGIRE